MIDALLAHCTWGMITILQSLDEQSEGYSRVSMVHPTRGNEHKALEISNTRNSR